MPTEMRQIVFRMVEVITAVTDYHRRRGIPLPTGSIVGTEIIEEDAIHAVIFIQAENGTTKFEVKAEVLAASLILFCINRKIPLPADADKRLQKVGDGAALLVTRRLQ